jgi:hypothetical protein
VSQFDSSPAFEIGRHNLFMALRINSTHDFDERGLDAYFTCPEAIRSLIILEGARLPRRIWERAAGDGAIVRELVASGRQVVAWDIHDYGLADCRILDYLAAPRMVGVEGIVTNPPFRLALEFALKAIAEVPYVALLTRLNFDAEGGRSHGVPAEASANTVLEERAAVPNDAPVRAGNKSTSNVGYNWLVWQRDAPREFPQDFDRKELLNAQQRLAV